MDGAQLENESFRVGDRVRLSAEGLKRRGSRGRPHQGVVVAVVRGSMSVRVLFKGYKNADPFALQIS